MSIRMISGALAVSILLLSGSFSAGALAKAGPDLPISWSYDEESPSLSLLGPISIDSDRQVTARKMLRTFGKTSRTRVRWGACQRIWRTYGMTAYFWNLGAARKGICKQRSASLQSLSIRRAATVDWHTLEGLRMGDSLGRLQELYPDSQEFEGNDGDENWSLSPTYIYPFGDNLETADVKARVENDAVDGFDIWVGGAGE